MASAISGILVRNSRQAVVDAAGESEEVQFNIPRRLAIGVSKIIIINKTNDLDAALIEMGTVISFDGPRYASDAIVSKALFEAEEVLDSTIAQAHMAVDNQTSGASQLQETVIIEFPEPIFTARNLGIARLSEGAGGEGFVAIYYKWFNITDAEFITLITDLRS